MRAIDTVTANGRKSCPAMPDTNAMGRNTATVVSVDAVIAPATCRTEATTPSTVSGPSPLRRLMFSMTTIESSTTRPMAMVSAPSVKMLRVLPLVQSPMRVMSRESGIETAAMTVDRHDQRNARITSTAKSSPSPPSTERSWIDCSMKGAWSKMVMNSASRVGARRSSSACTACEMSTTFAPCAGVICRVSDGLPLTRDRFWAGTASSSTSAKSEMRTAPSAVGTGSAAMSSREARGVPTVTEMGPSADSACPAGSAAPCDCRIGCRLAGSTSSRVTSAARRAIVMRCSCCPARSTVRTPGMFCSAGTTVWASASPKAS